MEIVQYKQQYKSDIISIWESSVRATHDFLTEENILFFKSFVDRLDFSAMQVYCSVEENDQLTGFIGVDNKKVEMLFLDPSRIGKGIGKRLLNFAIEHLDATELDVNEQNNRAVEFYKKAGFEVYERSEVDGTGKPFPILKMRIKNVNDKNKKMTNLEIAEAFSSGKFEHTYNRLADNIEWTVFGEKVLQGKEQVLAECEEVKEYFNSITTDFTNYNSIGKDNRIAINGHALFIREGKTVAEVNACDVYEFDEEGLITSIKSYCINEKVK
jgi:putative acetyltransferase